MQFLVKNPPREFSVGQDDWVTLRDCGAIALEPGEMAEVAGTNGEAVWRVARQPWGFAIPLPLNRPIGARGLRARIAGRSLDRAHLLLVDPALQDAFERYAAREDMRTHAELTSD